MSHKEFVTDETKMQVMCYVQMGVTQDRIAQHMGISANTLRKYYAFELEYARENIQNVVMGQLMKKVLDGNTSCVIFASKTICGLKETQAHEFIKPAMVIKPPEGERPYPLPPIHDGQEENDGQQPH